jgi:hypothetical protein
MTRAHLTLVFALEALRQACEQYFTSCQFLAQDLRQVMGR